MILRLTPALCILALAGCSTPEPQNVSYAPGPASVAPLPAPVMPGPINSPPLQAAPVQSGAMPPTPAPLLQSPTLQGQTSPAGLGEFAEAPSLQYTPTCSTVDNVTLCDAPPLSGGEDRLYTN